MIFIPPITNVSGRPVVSDLMKRVRAEDPIPAGQLFRFREVPQEGAPKALGAVVILSVLARVLQDRRENVDPRNHVGTDDRCRKSRPTGYVI